MKADRAFTFGLCTTEANRHQPGSQDMAPQQTARANSSASHPPWCVAGGSLGSGLPLSNVVTRLAHEPTCKREVGESSAESAWHHCHRFTQPHGGLQSCKAAIASAQECHYRVRLFRHFDAHSPTQSPDNTPPAAGCQTAPRAPPLEWSQRGGTWRRGWSGESRWQPLVRRRAQTGLAGRRQVRPSARSCPAVARQFEGQRNTCWQTIRAGKYEARGLQPTAHQQPLRSTNSPSCPFQLQPQPHHVCQAGRRQVAHPVRTAAAKRLLQPAQVVGRLGGAIVRQLQATIGALPAADRPLQRAGGGWAAAAAAHAAHAAVAHAALPAGTSRLAALDRVLPRQGQGQAAHGGAEPGGGTGRVVVSKGVGMGQQGRQRKSRRSSQPHRTMHPALCACSATQHRHNSHWPPSASTGPRPKPPGQQLTGGCQSGRTPLGSEQCRTAPMSLGSLPCWRLLRAP